MRAAAARRKLGDSVADLLFRILAVVSAIGAMLFVFNAMGDWFLLGIALVFLIALGWVAVKAAPQFAQQITLVLNMGSVREGEFFVFGDVPWRVESLGFTAVLRNERLEGGVQQLPVRMLVGLHSRPLGEHEELFPSASGDWVQLADDTLGRVVCQTPAIVELELLGGARKTYRTADFLAEKPANLSGKFRVETVFGIDYRHQAEATTTIPTIMKDRLERELPTLLTDGELLRVQVEFCAAAASSLDYRVQVDLAGSAASKFGPVNRAISRILVDACNEHDWKIPFQQVTLHRAGASG